MGNKPAGRGKQLSLHICVQINTTCLFPTKQTARFWSHFKALLDRSKLHTVYLPCPFIRHHLYIDIHTPSKKQRPSLFRRMRGEWACAVKENSVQPAISTCCHLHQHTSLWDMKRRTPGGEHLNLCQWHSSCSSVRNECNKGMHGRVQTNAICFR